MPSRASGAEFIRPVVWVVGASRGIGREIAVQFAMLGCHVCISSRSAVPLRKLADELGKRGGIVSVYPCDIRNRVAVGRTTRAIERKLGGLDALVLNAGITSFRDFCAVSQRESDDILATNFLGPLSCLRSVLPGMMKRKRGWIATVLTTAAITTYPGSSIYSGAKAGLHAALKVIREEVRPYNVRIINVLPGATETSMWSGGARKRHGKNMMRPAHVAEVIADLFNHPADVVAEEVVLRPPLGDIK